MSSLEVWRIIPGYEGRYEVSNKGNVRSFFAGKVKRLKPMISAGRYNGYQMVTLYGRDKAGRKVKIHRLVAEAFIPNPARLPEINHKDENKTNNDADNLEWCTHTYNSTYGTSRQRAVATLRRHKATDSCSHD